MDKECAFYRIIMNRSNENERAFSLLYENQLFGHCIALLRLETESYMKCIYLSQFYRTTKEKLINQFFEGEEWTILTAKGKSKKITDRDILNSIKQIGWEESIYKFGCAFIHLSNKWGYSENDVFQALNKTDQQDIVDHINTYHSTCLSLESSQESVFDYLPDIFNKIQANLICHVKDKVKFLEAINFIEKEPSEN